MALTTLRIALQTSYVEDDEYALSFFGENGLTLAEIIQAARRTYPGSLEHKKVRYTTVGRLAESGFKIDRNGTFPHLANVYKSCLVELLENKSVVVGRERSLEVIHQLESALEKLVGSDDKARPSNSARVHSTKLCEGGSN